MLHIIDINIIILLQFGKGMFPMKTVVKGFSKFVVANVAIVFAIMLLPVFLVTDDVSAFNQIMQYLFGSDG